MSIFKRMKTLTQASINDALDKAEDPVKMVNQLLRDLEQDIADAEVSVSKQIAIEKKLEQQYLETQEMVEKREEQAVKALDAGKEDLARKALQDKKENESKMTSFKEQYENAKSNADHLRRELSELKDDYEEMKHKKDTLVARAESAKAQKQINQAMSGIGTGSTVKGFERIEDKVLQMEAEASTSREMRRDNRTLDDELEELERDSVDDELSALKARISEKKASSGSENG